MKSFMSCEFGIKEIEELNRQVNGCDIFFWRITS